MHGPFIWELIRLVTSIVTRSGKKFPLWFSLKGFVNFFRAFLVLFEILNLPWHFLLLLGFLVLKGQILIEYLAAYLFPLG